MLIVNSKFKLNPYRMLDFSVRGYKKTLQVFAFGEGNKQQMVNTVRICFKKTEAFANFSAGFGQKETKIIESQMR